MGRRRPSGVQSLPGSGSTVPDTPRRSQTRTGVPITHSDRPLVHVRPPPRARLRVGRHTRRGRPDVDDHTQLPKADHETTEGRGCPPSRAKGGDAPRQFRPAMTRKTRLVVCPRGPWRLAWCVRHSWAGPFDDQAVRWAGRAQDFPLAHRPMRPRIFRSNHGFAGVCRSVGKRSSDR